IIGYLLHWGLFGMLTLQLCKFGLESSHIVQKILNNTTDNYYRAFPNDRKLIQCLVYGVYLIEVVQTILMTHDAFTNFGTGFGNSNTLRGVHFDWLTIPVMSGIVAFIAQTFYAYRVYLLSRSWVLPSLIVAVSLLSSISGIMNGSFSQQVGVVPPPHTTRNSVISALWLGGAALSDIIIAVALLKNDTGLRRTHMLVVKLIRLTIETGSLTAAVAFINLALFFSFPSEPYFFTAGVLLPKLYANTMLAVLNSRMRIVGGRGDVSSSVDLPFYQSMIRESSLPGGNTRSQPPVVTITREIFSDRELTELVEMRLKKNKVSNSSNRGYNSLKPQRQIQISRNRSPFQLFDGGKLWFNSA
ncbi:hypothetical protein R3P38DRAFT_2532364, partial [Favolaschia claudopus]